MVRLETGVFSDPSPRERQYLGTVKEKLSDLGLSPKKNRDESSAYLEIGETRHIPEEDAVYYFVPSLAGWVIKTPSKPPESTAARRRKKEVRMGQLGLEGEFSRVPQVSVRK